MEAQLTMASVKTLTKTLACLSRYSDDMDILALPNSLTLSATNSSKSAYCRLLLRPSFFSSYSVRTPGSSFRSADTQVEEGRSVKARLKTKLLLSYLRHRNHEKGVRSVKLIIREPPQDGSSVAPGTDEESSDEERSMESRMLVKFFCDHGVVKQHRLTLEHPDELLAPAAEEDPQQKTVVISRPALRSLLDRMRVGASKADGQISCEFNPADLIVKTAADKGEIYTEVKMIGTDLIRYDAGNTSTSLSFHIREFSATITLAESLEKYLTLTFTAAPAPLILAILPTNPEEKEGDDWEFQAYIATSRATDVTTDANSALRRDRDLNMNLRQTSLSGEKIWENHRWDMMKIRMMMLLRLSPHRLLANHLARLSVRSFKYHDPAKLDPPEHILQPIELLPFVFLLSILPTLQ
ncbi:hypothetical protein CALVIDRAFT_559357 [Calocera viscosa TUFC12733]|uniref:Rad9-domain-containing protein n=1 Tax=Calocera viscosa (strain TUFC12733) TaxID=1330018 RepID=A0A167S3D5_CALVF|nr:hypothetical protein CALVIDRAFT_559357 [Calocera viscosa TUFC12733]